jgi:hypothetical protein
VDWRRRQQATSIKERQTMKGYRVLVWTAIFAVAAVGATGAMAVEAKTFPLMGQKDSPKASGSARIEGAKLAVAAKGLRPNAVYTVWFVNMQPSMSKAGAGSAPYSFKSDATGNATYTAELGESPIGKWQVIFIIRHPSGDPTDMAKTEDALMTKLM